MINIVVISGTVRVDRKSHHVAKYLTERLSSSDFNSTTELFDVKEYNLPLMEYKFDQHPNPSASMKQAQAVLDKADGFIIVSPEYNGDVPGVLKNTLDYFYTEYREKTFGICSVSGGARAGIRVGLNLRQQALNYNGIVLPRMLNVANVQDKFDDNSKLVDESFKKDADAFLEKMVWLTEAIYDKKNS